MIRNPSARISLGLASIATTVVVLALVLRLWPEPGIAGRARPLLPFVVFFALCCFLAFFLFIRFIIRQLGLDAARDLAAPATPIPPTAETVASQPAPAEPPTEIVATSPPRPEKTVSGAPNPADTTTVPAAAAAFETVAEVEQKNAQLRKLLGKLQRSRTEIQRQNRHLRDLATKDPLTGCLNRRAFFPEFETHWAAAHQAGHPLSCVMVDVDHFKAINDTHGHSTGDVVLKQVAATLRDTVRKGDLVCRYGGEEFCVLLVDLSIDDAVQAAERLRTAIADRRPARRSITASLGVSAAGLGATTLHELLDQADKALYVAKRTGRNRVVRWDGIPPGQRFDDAPGRPQPAKDGPPAGAISFQAVNALLAPLNYRNPEAAEHCRRVADLCVAVADGLVPRSECYLLEVAALLHDVGKLGVPDAVLLKPGPLDAAEWKVLKAHEVIGVEMIESVFGPGAILDIVRGHHVPFAGEPGVPAGPRGTRLPLGARILAVADAYDSMTSNQVYRARSDAETAFAELRRCAGTQFDPELVERLIRTVRARDARHPAGDAGRPGEPARDFGRQLEAWAAGPALKDRAELIATVTRLKAMAAEHGLPAVAETAGQVLQLAEAGMGTDSLTRLTLDMLAMCRPADRVPADDVPAGAEAT
jgi:diguanylate cyclase (GGDEF)-like protein